MFSFCFLRNGTRERERERESFKFSQSVSILDVFNRYSLIVISLLHLRSFVVSSSSNNLGSLLFCQPSSGAIERTTDGLSFTAASSSSSSLDRGVMCDRWRLVITGMDRRQRKQYLLYSTNDSNCKLSAFGPGPRACLGPSSPPRALLHASSRLRSVVHHFKHEVTLVDSGQYSYSSSKPAQLLTSSARSLLVRALRVLQVSARTQHHAPARTCWESPKAFRIIYWAILQRM